MNERKSTDSLGKNGNTGQVGSGVVLEVGRLLEQKLVEGLVALALGLHAVASGLRDPVVVVATLQHEAEGRPIGLFNFDLIRRTVQQGWVHLLKDK